MSSQWHTDAVRGVPAADGGGSESEQNPWDAIRNWDTIVPAYPPPPASEALQKASEKILMHVSAPPPVARFVRPRPFARILAACARCGDAPGDKSRVFHTCGLEPRAQAKDNDAEGVRRLVAQGVDPSYGNSIAQTALHIAALWGSLDAGRALLEAGAKIDAQNTLSGATPLHMAVQRDQAR